jgi:hypothetical protein
MNKKRHSPVDDDDNPVKIGNRCENYCIRGAAKWVIQLVKPFVDEKWDRNKTIFFIGF